MRYYTFCLVAVGLLFGVVGCGKESPASNEKSVMVIPVGGRPVDPLQKTMNYPRQRYMPNMPIRPPNMQNMPNYPWPNR